jgi:hypothetical protein
MEGFTQIKPFANPRTAGLANSEPTMDGKETRAERFRRLAREARQSAGLVSAHDAKATLLRIAEDYERLAQHAERDQQSGK